MQPYSKILENCVYALAVTRKRQVAPGRLLQLDTLDLHQVRNGVQGCVRVKANGQNKPDFIDARVNINDTYYS